MARQAHRWLYEEGIGENRAILVDGESITEAAIELPGRLKLGSVVEAKLTSIIGGRRGIVALTKSDEILLDPLPAGLTEGQSLRVEIVREAIPEPGRAKLPKCRLTELALRDGPSLLDRISESGTPVSIANRHEPDAFEQAGWTELLEEASSGEIAFPGGALRLSLTPAMTLVDVDGDLPAAELAVAGAQAAARVIRRLGIGGSIGIDLPTVAGREARQRAAAAVDSVLPQPFERTSVNGFGFLQIVRRRVRPSLAEIVQYDRVGAAARSLLRRAERTEGAGASVIQAAPALVARIESEPEWLALLERRSGCHVTLRGDASLDLAAGHVQRSAA